MKTVVVSIMTVNITVRVTDTPVYISDKPLHSASARHAAAPRARAEDRKLFQELFPEPSAEVVSALFPEFIPDSFLKTYTCKRPTRVICINIKVQKKKTSQNQNFPQHTQIAKYELCNSYKY